MQNLLFNTLLTITPHNTQKRRRRKEGWQSSRWVTHPVRNPDWQGLTWALELIKLNFSGRNSYFGGIFCLEYPSRRNENRLPVVPHFSYNYRFSFHKLQIFISQTTDFHFVSFHFVLFRFVSQTTVSPFKLPDFILQTSVLRHACTKMAALMSVTGEGLAERRRQSFFWNFC